MIVILIYCILYEIVYTKFPIDKYLHPSLIPYTIVGIPIVAYVIKLISDIVAAIV